MLTSATYPCPPLFFRSQLSLTCPLVISKAIPLPRLITSASPFSRQILIALFARFMACCLRQHDFVAETRDRAYHGMD